eukprot:6553876-Alexandrium_andersonii.AAC.1
MRGATASGSLSVASNTTSGLWRPPPPGDEKKRARWAERTSKAGPDEQMLALRGPRSSHATP